MTDDLVAHIKDRGDWLVDAVATATQNRQFLRGDPECDDVACDAIRLNGEKAMSLIAKPLSARIEALEAKLAKAVDVIEWALIAWDEHCKHGYNMQGDWVHDARATLAELTGGKDD